MPSYSIINNAVFQPFTYQELALPLMQMQQKQEALEEEYDKLSAQADVLEAMGRNDRDIASGAYAKYKAFSDELRARADALYENGLDYDSRVRLHEMKRMYNTDIVPIQNAWQKRELESKAQMDAWAKDPSLMFSRDASKTNLDWYLDNPTGGFTTISGTNIRNYVATAATNLQKKIMSSPQDAIKLQKEDPELYYSLTRYGLSPETVRDWQNHPMLKQIVEDALTANGVTPEKLGSNYDNIYRQSLSHAGMGVWNAVGEDKIDWHTPPSAKSSSKGSGSGGEYDPFAIMNVTEEVDLPMMGADGGHRRDQQNALITLGGKEINKGKEDNKIQLSWKDNDVLIPSYDLATHDDNIFQYDKDIPLKDVSQKAKLYDSNGRLLSRENFMKQAKSESDKEKYSNYYTRVEESLATLGLEGTPKVDQIVNAYNKLQDDGSAKHVKVYPLEISNTDWSQHAKTLLAQKIKRYKNGKPVYDSESVPLGQLLRKKDDNDVVNTSAYFSRSQGEEGIIIASDEDGKSSRYFIPLRGLSTNVIDKAMQHFAAADRAKQLYDISPNPAAKRIVEKNIELAIDALVTGLTIQNKGYSQNRTQHLTQSQISKMYGLDVDNYNNELTDFE